MKQQLNVGIDIGTFLTKVVVTETTKEGSRIIASGIADTKGVRHGYIVNKEEVTASLSKALRLAEKESGTRIKHAAFAIGGVGIASEYITGTTTATRADGIIGKFDVENAIANAEAQLDIKNRAILHAFPVAFRVDDKELPTRPDGMSGSKLEVKTLFITCFQQHIDDLVAVANDAGIKITSLTATPIAAHKALLTDLQRNFGCALIDIGAESVSVSVFENNMLSALHVFSIGSFDITKDIALGLRVTPEEAENFKLGVVTMQQLPKKKLDEIIEARISDIFELIDKYFKKIGRSGLLPAGAIIIGGGGQLAMTEEVARTMLKIPARKGQIEMPSSKGTSKDYRLTVAYAVALASMEDEHAGGSRGMFGASGDSFITVIRDFLKQLLP